FSSDLEIKIENIEEISCYGKSDGSIAISVSGGAGQYSFLWKMEAGSFSATSQNISSLEKGNYILEVTDANFHKIASDPISIKEPEILTMQMPSLIHLSCNGVNDGSIIAGNVTGGTGDFFYS